MLDAVQTAAAVPAIALPTTSQLLQFLLLALIPVGLYVVLSGIWPSQSDGSGTQIGWRHVLAALGVVVVPLLGILWLRGMLSLDFVLTMPTTNELLQILLALSIPVGVYMVLTESWPTGLLDFLPTLGWKRLLLVIGTVVIPLLGILWLRGLLPSLDTLQSFSQAAQVALLGLIPVGLYLVFTDTWPTRSDSEVALNGWKDVAAAVGSIVVPIVGVLWLQGFFASTTLEQVAQFLLFVSIPLGLYVVFTQVRMPGEWKLLASIVVIVGPLAGILWLQGMLTTVLVAFTKPTMGQWLQLALGAMIPLGLYLVITQTRTIRWTDLLLAIGLFVLPVVVILQMQGIMPIEVSTAVVGYALGHTMEMLDED